MTTTCRTCTRPLSEPYRVYSTEGHVVQGCIAADHDGYMTGNGESAKWHNRETAKAYRAKETIKRHSEGPDSPAQVTSETAYGRTVALPFVLYCF